MIVTHSQTVSQAQAVQVRPLTMPDRIKTDIITRALAVHAVVDPLGNAAAAAQFPGVDFYIPAGPNCIECYSKTMAGDVRSFHRLPHDCRETIPGKPCQEFVTGCSDCEGFSRWKACRHANPVTGIYNQPILAEKFRAGAHLRWASECTRLCPTCSTPTVRVPTVRVRVQEEGHAGMLYVVCVNVRGGKPCEWGKTA